MEMRLFFAVSCAALGALDLILMETITTPFVKIICLVAGLYCIGVAGFHLYKAVRR